MRTALGATSLASQNRLLAMEPVDIRQTANRAWLRALELTAPIASNRHRLLSTVIEERAQLSPDAPALLSDRQRLTYRALAERSNRYARWALEQGIRKGDTVGLMMPNRPDYLALWLGVTRVGGVVALLNTSLTGASLAHSIDLVAPRHIVAASDLMGPLSSALRRRSRPVTVWSHGRAHDGFPCIEHALDRHTGETLSATERPDVTIDDVALHIYTSGTTGLPKAVNITHGRVMQWSHWFAGMTGAGPSDRMYNCLPMSHSVGGVVATGALLVAGGSVVIRDRFSATEFWADIVGWDCTLFQYIGELCRYLLRAEPTPHETQHRLRLCCGNGLAAAVWNDFKDRFRLPRILEFYAATEGCVSLFNPDGRRGAVGRIPAFLAHRDHVRLVQVDLARDEPVRDDHGFCVPAVRGEAGEAIGRLPADAASLGTRFEGYTSEEDSEEKILRDVFERGDAWFRTGDLMRQDGHGYFYFIDRLGDTFRWKGENVSASEVSQALCEFPGIGESIVYGVDVPDADGRAGMAALVVDRELDLTALRRHLVDRLPAYARPLFLRIRHELRVTSTFKYAKRELVQLGYDPTGTTDVIYFNDHERDAFVRLDAALYERIRSGRIRL